MNTIKKPSISGSIEGIIAPSCPIETSQSPRIGEIQQYAEEVSTFLERDSINAKVTNTIKIFISYATVDSSFFQISDVAKLLMQNPEPYRNIIVKVGGYSAYFTDLGREIQDEVISRTEHLKV